MDEASSRFVDRLVMSKLLTEKLEKVHHRPTVPLEQIDPRMFGDFDALARTATMMPEPGGRSYRFRSPVWCEHVENRTGRVICYDCPNERGTMLMVHGLFEDNREIYHFLIGGLNKAGYSVRMITLPFHYERAPSTSQFSGEYFWSADTVRTLRALKQSVYELYQVHNWLEERSATPVFIAAFSMGARVALILASLFADAEGMFLINPAAPLSDIVWDSPLCRTIKDDYLSAGYDRHELERTYARFEPMTSSTSSLDRERICMAYGLYDEVTEQAQYRRVARDWRLKHVLPYKAGHLNTLRLPRLADDIVRFFDGLSVHAGNA